ncbi:MAG: gliding motility-associated C-terminal domain-containing protein [Bacteroidales bacterium]|nr:gliding motility-associated C-terminal domain-containing protein [Bacteroidales bacterium]
MKSLLRKLSSFAILIILLTGSGMAQVADFVYFNPCKGQATQFVNASTYPSGVTAYEWNFGDGSVLQYGQEVTHIFTQHTVFSVTLTLYNGLVVVDQISKNVAIYRIPNASFTASVACLGDPVEFTNTSTNSDGSLTDWIWSFGDGEGDVLPAVNHTYVAPDVYSVSLVVQNSFGCKDTFMADVATYPLPNATITAESEGVCEGSPMRLSVSDSYEEVIWSTNPDLTTPSIQAFNIEVNLAVGNHTIVAKVYEIHADYPFFQVCQDVDTIDVFVTPTPEIVLTASETNVVPGATVELGVSSSNGTLSSYFWTPTLGMPNPYLANPAVLLYETTLFTVVVKDNAGCEASGTILIEVDLKPNTVLTPNGDGKNDTWIVNEGGLSSDFTLIIFNRWGEKVHEEKGYSNDWDGSHNGVQLPDGAYYYVIKHEDAVYTGPINLLR